MVSIQYYNKTILLCGIEYISWLCTFGYVPCSCIYTISSFWLRNFQTACGWVGARFQANGKHIFTQHLYSSPSRSLNETDFIPKTVWFQKTSSFTKRFCLMLRRTYEPYIYETNETFCMCDAISGRSLGYESRSVWNESKWLPFSGGIWQTHTGKNTTLIALLRPPTPKVIQPVSFEHSTYALA